MSAFENVKKNFGFGCMRFPMIGDEVDTDAVSEMFDAFIAAGFNYFDTAHGYIGGKSETVVKKCLAERYPREAFVLTNKLSHNFFSKEEDVRPLFEAQLEACGVEYFDFYLMHAQERSLFEKYKKCRAYETALELLAEGKIRHFGISFHDKAEVLDEILTAYPEIEAVQIQFNYADYDDASVQSKAVLDVCLKHGKEVIVMEPVRGGALIDLPEEAQKVLDALDGGSNASYAIRFAASFEGVKMVLSGMGSMDMVNDNVGYMKDFKPLDEGEMAAVMKVSEIFKSADLIPCTACKYCVDGCPMNIPIPSIFACLNTKKRYGGWGSGYYYSIHTKDAGKASDCIGCGACEASCPQHLEIRRLLSDAADAFEKK